MQKNVIVKITMKRINQKVPWYYARCRKCKIEILVEAGRYKCSQCHRIIPHPEKRYLLYKFRVNHMLLLGNIDYTD